jgi:hypothetical protein
MQKMCNFPSDSEWRNMEQLNAIIRLLYKAIIIIIIIIIIALINNVIKEILYRNVLGWM